MISAAIQKSEDLVYVYDDDGRLAHQLSGKLEGYTAHNVMIRHSSSLIYVYDDSGRLIRQISG